MKDALPLIVFLYGVLAYTIGYFVGLVRGRIKPAIARAVGGGEE